MNNHINQICKACFYHIHNIRRISKFLSKECLQTLVHAFVTSRLDYCNSLLYGLPKYQICKPQRVQNTAARLISNTGKYDRISPVLYNLYWLTLFYLIYFKILTVTFKAIHGMSPCYISDLASIRTCSVKKKKKLTAIKVTNNPILCSLCIDWQRVFRILSFIIIIIIIIITILWFWLSLLLFEYFFSRQNKSSLTILSLRLVA